MLRTCVGLQAAKTQHLNQCMLNQCTELCLTGVLSTTAVPDVLLASISQEKGLNADFWVQGYVLVLSKSQKTHGGVKNAVLSLLGKHFPALSLQSAK